MFNPTQADVRRFFCQTFAKHQAKQVLTPLENIAARWIVEHPEYHADLSNEAQALNQIYPPEGGKTNPFLHLSMHLSISEQVQADMPPGLKQAYAMALSKRGDPHLTHHAVMEVLGKVLWQAQRAKLAPDMDAFVDGVRRLA